MQPGETDHWEVVVVGGVKRGASFRTEGGDRESSIDFSLIGDLAERRLGFSERIHSRRVAEEAA